MDVSGNLYVASEATGTITRLLPNGTLDLSWGTITPVDNLANGTLSGMTSAQWVRPSAPATPNCCCLLLDASVVLHSALACPLGVAHHLTRLQVPYQPGGLLGSPIYFFANGASARLPDCLAFKC